MATDSRLQGRGALLAKANLKAPAVATSTTTEGATGGFTNSTPLDPGCASRGGQSAP